MKKQLWPLLLLPVMACAHHGEGGAVPAEGLTWSSYLQQLGDQMLIPAQAQASITVREIDGKRVIDADGIPLHATGRFPNRNNPNRIRSQSYHLQMPLHPQKAAQPTFMRGQPFGISLGGVLFDPGTAEFWRGNRQWRMEAIGGPRNLGLDRNNAHVQPNGAYHYHGIPIGLFNRERRSQQGPILLGWAADGFPIYGPEGYADPKDAGSPLVRLKPSWLLRTEPRDGGPGGQPDGSYTRDFGFVAGSGDLDRCNGRFAVTPEMPEGGYHYVLTTGFPFIPRCWMGTPDPSFAQLRPGPGGGLGPGLGGRGVQGGRFGPPGGLGRGGQGGPGGRFGEPPPQALEACEGRSNESACSVDTPHGRLSGTCRDVPSGELACVPEGGRRGPPPF